MLKQTISLQDTDSKVYFNRFLLPVLTSVPQVKLEEPITEALPYANTIVHLDLNGTPWTLLFEVKRDSQLRHVRAAIYQLHHHLGQLPEHHKYGVVIGPYISKEAAELLCKASMGFVDFAGNCFLNFGGVHIERRGFDNPFVRARPQRSLFAPKSARVLIALLSEPGRIWKVQELAAAAYVSTGHISTVRRGLIDREWAKLEAGRLRLSRADALLDAWRDSGERRIRERQRFHTVLHGKTLDAAVREALAAAGDGAHAILASTSAARWLAPYVTPAVTHFYADEQGETILREHLKLHPVERGENVVIERPLDDNVFVTRVPAAPGIWTTDPVRTYIDLSASGERAAEAAEHLRATLIDPKWKAHEAPGYSP